MNTTYAVKKLMGKIKKAPSTKKALLWLSVCVV